MSMTSEYGTNVLTMHKDAIKPGQRVLITDDLLATGGTIEAAIKLVEKLGGIVVGIAFIIELKYLNGIEKIKDYDVMQFNLIRRIINNIILSNEILHQMYKNQ